MSDNLYVQSEYLEKLAVEQEEAAAEIESAKAETDGLAYKLIWDHGLASGSLWMEMFNTERERAVSCDNMTKMCTDLAARLRNSVTAYRSTDEQTGENLDQQMLPG